jgi:hypothetical protein
VDASKEISMQQLMKEMEKGKNPVMPGKHCANPASPPQLDAENFDIVWFEEGDCAALLYKDEPIAVIPAWCTPGLSTTLGYSKEFVGEEFIGIKPLKDILPRLSKRIELAKKFWSDWEEESKWEQFLKSHTEVLEKAFGPHTKMYSIDNSQWPPKVILQFEQDNAYILVTVGVSIMAQPRVELFMNNFSEIRRAEWGMAISKEIADKVSIEKIGEYLSKCVCLPWDQLLWLDEGRTIECDLFPPSVLLTKQRLSAPKITLPDFRGDPVNLLWAVPLTTQEATFLQTHNSSELFPLLEKAGCTWIHKNRKNAVE